MKKRDFIKFLETKTKYWVKITSRKSSYIQYFLIRNAYETESGIKIVGPSITYYPDQDKVIFCTKFNTWNLYAEDFDLYRFMSPPEMKHFYINNFDRFEFLPAYNKDHAKIAERVYNMKSNITGLRDDIMYLKKQQEQSPDNKEITQRLIAAKKTINQEVLALKTLKHNLKESQRKIGNKWPTYKTCRDMNKIVYSTYLL